MSTEARASDAPDAAAILAALTTLKEGNLTIQLPTGQPGVAGEIAETFNTFVHSMKQFAKEVSRIAWETGTEGRFGGQAEVENVSGTWQDLVTGINTMSANLTNQVRAASRTARSVTTGDSALRPSGQPAAHGEMAELLDALDAIADAP